MAKMSEKTAMTVVFTVAIVMLVIAVLLWWSTAYI
jgi:hypothetical protein